MFEDSHENRVHLKFFIYMVNNYKSIIDHKNKSILFYFNLTFWNFVFMPSILNTQNIFPLIIQLTYDKIKHW